MTTKQIIRKNFLSQQVRNRREDVQNLSTRDCAGLWGSHGKFACFCSILQSGTVDTPPTRLGPPDYFRVSGPSFSKSLSSG